MQGRKSTSVAGILMNNHTKPAGGSVGIVSAFSGQLASLPGVPFKGMWAGNWLLISAGMLLFFQCVTVVFTCWGKRVPVLFILC